LQHDAPTAFTRRDSDDMPTRFLWAALLMAASILTSGPAAADDAADIERLFRAGQVDQALRLADAAIADKPRHAQVRFLKGVMLTELKRNEEATQIFIALTEDFPELPDPYNNLAVLYAANGQLQSALVALQTALRNDPKHLAARENLGNVHLALAQEAWVAAQAQSKGEDAELRRKLRLAREIQLAPLPAAAQRAPG
jgi:Flp pilus assembly protein TadD